MNYRQTAVTVIMLIFFPFYGVCWLKAYPGIVYPQCGKRFFGKGGSFGGGEMGSETPHKLWCSSGYENLVRVSDRFRYRQWPDE